MAKSSVGKGSGGTSRIRFIMLDAELPDGDLTQITQAIQNALRPNTTTQPRLIVSPPVNAASSNAQSNSAHSNGAEPEDMPQEVTVSEEPTSSPSQSSQPRKYRTPKVIELDLNSEPSFTSYATAKNPPSDQMKFLVAAAWLQEHRGINKITMDHVYTCFRAMRWPTNIPDFDAPLRQLKKRQLLEKVGKGAYSVNHLGLSEVDKPRAA